jgi:RNA-directed DNA polymerase
VLLAAMALFIKGIACTKVRSLMKLGGGSERLAIACGITSTKVGAWKRGPCRSSKTKGINIALGNDYLVSLRDIWINIHYGR